MGFVASKGIHPPASSVVKCLRADAATQASTKWAVHLNVHAGCSPARRHLHIPPPALQPHTVVEGACRGPHLPTHVGLDCGRQAAHVCGGALRHAPPMPIATAGRGCTAARCQRKACIPIQRSPPGACAPTACSNQQAATGHLAAAPACRGRGRHARHCRSARVHARQAGALLLPLHRALLDTHSHSAVLIGRRRECGGQDWADLAADARLIHGAAAGSRLWLGCGCWPAWAPHTSRQPPTPSA